MGTHTATVCLGTPVLREQPAGANRLYEIDISALAVAAWQPSISIEASALMRPTSLNQVGFIFQNGPNPGQTGELEPAWPRTAGGTVNDGSATWTAIVPPAAGADSIESVTWATENPPDATLLISGQSQDKLTASAYLGGGTSGNVYLVLATITTALGAVYPVQIYLTIL